VAKTVTGVKVQAANLKPGTLTNISITPDEGWVQATTAHNIKFTSASTLYSYGVIQIKMPPRMILKAVGETVEIKSQDKSFTATTGKVLNGQIIEIANIFGPEVVAPEAPHDFDFWIYNSTNQNTAIDAGQWEIQTYARFQGDDTDYPVDKGFSKTSFVAEVGKISAAGEIQVTNAVTSGLNSTYTLSFIVNGRVEKYGKIVVQVPPQIELIENKVPSSGSCV